MVQQQHNRLKKHSLEDLLHEIKDTASELTMTTSNYIRSRRPRMTQVKKLRDKLSGMKHRLLDTTTGPKETKEPFENVQGANMQSTITAYKQCTDKFCGQLQNDVLRKNQGVMKATLRMINISKKMVQGMFDHKLSTEDRASKREKLNMQLASAKIAVIVAIDKMMDSTAEDKYLRCSVTNCKEATLGVLEVFRKAMPNAENARAGNISAMNNSQLIAEIKRKSKKAITLQVMK